MIKQKWKLFQREFISSYIHVLIKQSEAFQVVSPTPFLLMYLIYKPSLSTFTVGEWNK